MAIQAVKIPQNVYIEDRIIGPITLRQIIICALGGGFSYAQYAMFSKAYGPPNLILTVLIWVPAAIAAAFAFVKINDVSLLRMLLLIIERFNKPMRRIWSPRRGLTINIRTFTTPDESRKRREHVDAQTMGDARLTELTRALDGRINEKDPEENEPGVGDDPLERDAAIDGIGGNGAPAQPVRPEQAGVSLMHDIRPPAAA